MHQEPFESHVEPEKPTKRKKRKSRIWLFTRCASPRPWAKRAATCVKLAEPTSVIHSTHVKVWLVRNDMRLDIAMRRSQCAATSVYFIIRLTHPRHHVIPNTLYPHDNPRRRVMTALFAPGPYFQSDNSAHEKGQLFHTSIICAHVCHSHC